jgi:hypothetical protein
MFININQPWPYLATAVFIALIGFYAMQRPRRPGSRYFSWIVAFWLVWALAAALSTVVQSGELRYGLWALQSICALIIAPIQLMFALEYTGREEWLSRRILFLLIVPALMFAFFVLIFPSNSLVSIDSQAGSQVIHGREPLRWGFFRVLLGHLVGNP